jgi:integrase
MATIIKRPGKDGKPSYQVRIRVRGCPPSSATFSRLIDARSYATQVEAQIAEGRYLPQAEARRHTLADAIDRYLKDILPSKAPNSILMQRGQLIWWRDQLGYVRLSDLTAPLILDQRDVLLQTRKGSTVNRYMSAMSHCLTVCVRRWHWLQESPLKNVSRLRESPGRVRYLDVGERERLLAACKAGHHRYLYPVVVLTLCTGCRSKEITGLKWSQIGTGYAAITVLGKNRETRRVPVVEPARSVLSEHGRTRRIVGCDWVFPARSLRGPCDVHKAWGIARSQAGLVDFRFHDLRHTTASYLAMSGATLLEIAEILGHKQLQMVRRYAHLSESSVEGTLSRAMDQFLG